MRPILALDLNVFLLKFVFSFIGIFEPLYIFSLTGNFFWVAFFMFVIAATTLIFLIPAGNMIAKHGIGRAALISGLTRSAYLFCLILAPKNPPLFIALAAVFAGITVPYYWTTYHLINILEVRKKAWGKQISYLLILGTLGGLVGPAVGGVVIEKLGFPALYTFAVVMALFANLLLFFFHRQYRLAKISFGGLQKDLFTKGFLYMLIGYGGARLMGTIGAVLFPFLAFEVTGKSYGTLGFLASASVLISVVPLLSFGRLTDKAGVSRLFSFGAISHALLWIWRGLIKTPIDFVAVSVADRFLAGSYEIPFDDLTYRLAKTASASGGSSLPFLIKREIAIWMGGLSRLLWFLRYILLRFLGWPALSLRLWPLWPP